MRVLLTRPRPDSEALAAVLAGRGIDCVIAPMLEIAELAGPPLRLDGVQAALVTSANGARAFARRTARRDLPAFAVGDRTAAALRESGFEAVASADGAADDLAALVERRADPAAGALLHVRGRDAAADLAGTLEGAGFTVREAVLYRAEPAADISPSAADAIRGGGVDAALFFSPRSAATFATLALQAGLAEACGRMAALCLSAAVVEALRPVRWRCVAIAAHPRQANLLALLDRSGGAGQPQR